MCDVDPSHAVAARLRDTRLRRGRAAHAQAPRARRRGRRGGGRAGRALARASAEPPAQPDDEIWRALRLGLRDYVDKNGFGQVVIGLSGGIDSALVAALAADALGPERVEAISMPTRFNASETRTDAAAVAERLGVGFRELADRGAAASPSHRCCPRPRASRPRTCRRGSAA